MQTQKGGLFQCGFQCGRPPRMGTRELRVASHAVSDHGSNEVCRDALPRVCTTARIGLKQPQGHTHWELRQLSIVVASERHTTVVSGDPCSFSQAGRGQITSGYTCADAVRQHCFVISQKLVGMQCPDRQPLQRSMETPTHVAKSN